MSEDFSIEQKDAAIRRHYDTATNPYLSAEQRSESGNALRILSRATGRRIIINILDRLTREGKTKNR